MDNADSSKELAATTSEDQSDPTAVVKPAKKKFVKPDISVPVDVLEATTFFQQTDSGVTN